ncbi:MAG TPA: class I SAM-dependent methyltransferase [Gemmataceae bacterium]|nr:class I SAM-dependent methyltransferase [Gemmataceae bacterium]
MGERPPTADAGSRDLPGARGHVEADWASGVLTGYALLPDEALDSVAVSVNGTPAGSAKLGDRPDVVGAYPAIPHAGRSGFRLSPPAGLLRAGEVNRVEVVGCRGGGPVARFGTVVFPDDLVPESLAPPPVFIEKTQGDHDVAAYRALGFRYYQQLRDAVGRHRDTRGVRRLLDWGCGSGRVAAHFAREPGGPLVTGCDVDADAIRWCREHVRSGEFDVIDFSASLPYPDETFDVVVSLAVLAGFGPDAYRAWLPEVRRVLAPGGLFLASVQGPLAASFELPPEGLARLRRDSIADGGHGPGGWHGFYLTREYVRRAWGGLFEVLEHRETEINADQDLVVARRAG